MRAAHTCEGSRAGGNETTLFLIGDAGEQDPRTNGFVLDSLKRQASEAPGRTVIVFLGDNVYPNGIPIDSSLTWPDARRRLEAQMNAVPRGVRAIFIPGNHDWQQGGPYGLYSVRLQERMIASLAAGRDIRMLPSNGCPGPAAFEAGRLRLIALDTQWWLHEFIVRDANRNATAASPESPPRFASWFNPLPMAGSRSLPDII